MDTPTSSFGRRSAGFTIVELMFAVAIMGILAALAIVAYQDYTARTRMIEVLLAASGCRTPVSEAYVLSPVPPPSGGWGCETSEPTTTHVALISVDEHGKVSVTARGFNIDDIDGEILTLAPIIDGRPASTATDMGRRVSIWRCGSTEDGTTIPVRYLPSSCR